MQIIENLKITSLKSSENIQKKQDGQFFILNPYGFWPLDDWKANI